MLRCVQLLCEWELLSVPLRRGDTLVCFLQQSYIQRPGTGEQKVLLQSRPEFSQRQVDHKFEDSLDLTLM